LENPNVMNRASAPFPSRAPSGSPGIENYYRLHAQIYDATRWSFLFGRDAILELASSLHDAPARILEVGCGTGRNLVALARRYPKAQITGIDLSEAMLAIVRKKAAPFGSRVNLERRAYDSASDPPGKYDLVLCSYALSMFNPGLDAAVDAARRDLAVRRREKNHRHQHQRPEQRPTRGRARRMRNRGGRLSHARHAEATETSRKPLPPR
jgi:SAM-dependent methyltransferase